MQKIIFLIIKVVFWLIAPKFAFSLTMLLLVVKHFLIEQNNTGYGYYISLE